VRTVERDATARHDHVHVGMVGERRAPGMQHGGDANLGPQMLGIGGERESRATIWTLALLAFRGAGGRTMTNKSAPPLDEIDLLVGWRAEEDEYLFTKAVAMLREWLLDTEGEDRLRDVLKEILAEAGPPAENRPLD
jgi:hypothetical protein